LNLDAFFHEDSCSGATGAILRDFQGNFVAASTKYLPHVSTVAMAAEALAMREGLYLVNRMGCNNVIAESNSTEIAEACLGEQMWLSGSSYIHRLY
jgi:hypothetical protein